VLLEPNPPGAPTSAVSSTQATALPNWSPATPSLASSTACSFQVWLLRSNTYTTPRDGAPATEAPGAPTSATLPASASDAPNRSPAAPRLPIHRSCSDHLPPMWWNTYTAPCPAPLPLSAPSAPISAVSPSTCTAAPNTSPLSPSLASSGPLALQPAPAPARTSA
jgi:hypothetical protein